MDEHQETPGAAADQAPDPATEIPTAPSPSRPRPVRVPAADTVEDAAPEPIKQRQRTRAKICGITRIEDAELAVEHGAWAIGLIFWRGSKRRCRFEQAQAIGATFKRQVEVAGVFVNATLDEVVRTADACQLTIVQLHGDEGPSYCAEVARRTGCEVIKAARVRTGADVIALRPFHTDYHLLDTFVPGVPGGSGESFDHALASVRRAATGERQPKLILSGGLTPENVAEAIVEVRPFAVDVASGTESAPGIKDPAKVVAFLEAVHHAWDAPEEETASTEAAETVASPAAAESTPATEPADAAAETTAPSVDPVPPTPAEPSR
ncbi:MAG: phosphoribosylanthranilate isomerase [Patulibacter sp.]